MRHYLSVFLYKLAQMLGCPLWIDKLRWKIEGVPRWTEANQEQAEGRFKR